MALSYTAMGRPPRIQYEDALYHVYSRGNRKELTFLEDGDYQEFEDIILEQADRCHINLSAWCPMPNHFHLALKTPKANLSYYMQRVLTAWARVFNLKYKKVGHVFQGRFGAKLVNSEEYLRELIRYIHLNPYRAKNARWLIPEKGWPWSSHRFYINGNEPRIAAPYIHEVLQRFGEDLPLARKNYEKFVAEGLSSGQWEDFYKVREDRFIGNDEWIAETKVKFGERPEIIIPAPNFDVKKILLHTASETGISIARLSSESRCPEIIRAREIFAYVAMRIYQRNQTDIAHAISKNPSSVSRWLDKTSLGADDAILRRIVDRVQSEGLGLLGRNAQCNV